MLRFCSVSTSLLKKEILEEILSGFDKVRIITDIPELVTLASGDSRVANCIYMENLSLVNSLPSRIIDDSIIVCDSLTESIKDIGGKVWKTGRL